LDFSLKLFSQFVEKLNKHNVLPKAASTEMNVFICTWVDYGNAITWALPLSRIKLLQSLAVTS